MLLCLMGQRKGAAIGIQKRAGSRGHLIDDVNLVNPMPIEKKPWE